MDLSFKTITRFTKAARHLLKRDKKGLLSAKPNGVGLYHTEGMRFPQAGIGLAAVIMLENRDGDYDTILTQRGDHMLHGGKWGLLGGFLDIEKSEGMLEAIQREVKEESKGAINLDNKVYHVVLPPFMDYQDRGQNNKAVVCIQFLFVLSRQESTETRAALKKAIVTGDFDSEVKNFAIVPFKELQSFIKDNPFAFEHEKRAIQIIHKQLMPSPLMLTRAANVLGRKILKKVKTALNAA